MPRNPIWRSSVVLLALAALLAGCGAEPLAPDAGYFLIDETSFQEFAFSRWPALSCLEPGDVSSALIRRIGVGRYALDLSIVSARNCRSCTGPLTTSPLPPRELYRDEIAAMQGLFRTLHIEEPLDRDCLQSAPDLAYRTRWDGLEYRNYRCTNDHLRGDTLHLLLGFVDVLEKNSAAGRRAPASPARRPGLARPRSRGPSQQTFSVP